MQRRLFLEKIEKQFNIHSVCAILGPRQAGKTTLAQMFIEHKEYKNVLFFDLENPVDHTKLTNPMLALNIHADLVVIDEIQRIPEIFPVLRVIVDQKNFKTKYLILGSASRDLIQQSSETLAGRIGYIELTPFTLFETGNSKKLFFRGGFPLSYLPEKDEHSYNWRQNYITTFLERDIPNLGFSIPPLKLRRFWMMLVHYHGQVMNVSEIGKSMMISDHMVRKYVSILAGTFMIRILVPWFENIHKRQIKAPKIYFRDTGIMSALLLIENEQQLHNHPKLGAFWEGFALEEIILFFENTPEECFFWATQSNAELDILLFKQGKRIGIECKYSDAPTITKSMRIAMQDLKLDKLIIVYPGNDLFLLDHNIIGCGLDVIGTKKVTVTEIINM